MASPTRWTWVWVNSESWWWTGRPGVLWFMGSQRVGHDWVTELNWTDAWVNKHSKHSLVTFLYPTELSSFICINFCPEVWNVTVVSTIEKFSFIATWTVLNYFLLFEIYPLSMVPVSLGLLECTAFSPLFFWISKVQMVLLLEIISKRKGGEGWFSPIQLPRDLFIGYNHTMTLFLFLYEGFDLAWNKEGQWEFALYQWVGLFLG